MVVRRRPFDGRQSPRPNRTWGVHSDATLTSIAGGTKILIGGFSLSNQGIDETVLRVRGSMMVKPSVGVDALAIGAWGMCVVTDLAAAAGAASIPGPITNGGDDVWFVWEPIQVLTEFKDSTGEQFLQGHSFDSKAKRIVETGYQIAIMAENAHASQAFTLGLQFRLLSMVRGTR